MLLPLLLLRLLPEVPFRCHNPYHNHLLPPLLLLLLLLPTQKNLHQFLHRVHFPRDLDIKLRTTADRMPRMTKLLHDVRSLHTMVLAKASMQDFYHVLYYYDFYDDL